MKTLTIKVTFASIYKQNTELIFVPKERISLGNKINNSVFDQDLISKMTNINKIYDV